MDHLFRIGYHNWCLVGFYVLIVGVFIFGILRPRNKTEWRSAGIAQAWVIALYAEMYGIPLTMYLVAEFIGKTAVEVEQNHFFGHLWPLLFGTDDLRWLIVCDAAGQTLVILGAGLAFVGWRRIHRCKGQLVTDGIYRYIRHPQYTGCYLFLIGSILNWPTIITICMFPVLCWTYYRLARIEEADATREFGEKYREYMKTSGMFVPSLNARTNRQN